jgi:hypothetical protein
MAQIIAKVGNLSGEAFARDAAGNARRLKSGDVIREGETVSASEGAQVQLKMSDGRELIVRSGETAKMDAEVTAEIKPDAADSAVANNKKGFQKIAKAITGGGDLDALLEDPAAGGGGSGGEEGHSFIELMRIVENVDPLAFQFGTSRGRVLDTINGAPLIQGDVTVAAKLDPNSDSANRTDLITNDNTPNVMGTGTPGANITVVSPTGEVMTTKVAGDGTWSVTPLTPIPDGPVVFNVTASDVFGNTAKATVKATIDTVAQATITVDPITADNILTANEANTTIAVTGKVGGDAEPGDVVTLTINSKQFVGVVKPDLTYSIDVPGSDLAADPDTKVDAKVTGEDVAGNAFVATGDQVFDISASVVISDAGSVVEATGNYLTYNVSLSNPVAANTTVTLSLGGSAGSSDHGPLEYNNGSSWVAVPVSNQITLPATGTAVQVRVAVLDDTLTETAETVVLSAGSSSNPLVSTGDTGSGTITDDRSTTPGDNPDVDADTPASVVISDAGSVVEATGNYLTYNVSLSNPVAANTTVTLSLGGSAGSSDHGPLEYNNGSSWVAVPANNQITLPATGTAVQVRVAVLDDTLTETAETVVLSAGSSSNPLVSTGDTGSGTILDNDTPPTVGNSTASVSEEGLVNGIADSIGNPTNAADTTNLASVSGTIAVSDPDSVETVSLFAPATALSSGGVAVVWTASPDGHTLVGTAGVGGPEVLRATITDGGAYTVTLSKAIDHVTANGENVSTLAFGVRATDGVFTSQGTLTVNIEDDAPTAVPGTRTVVLPSQDSNIMLVLDVSGSMGSGPGSKLQIMKDSVTQMLDQYDNLGDVMVRVVTFSDSANAYQNVWVSVAVAKTYVNELTSNGATNYDAALLNAMSAFTSAGKIAGAQNVSYFLTDGAPTASVDWNSAPWNYTGTLPNSNGIQERDPLAPLATTEEGIWRNFLENNDINSFAYGMGTGATLSNMNPVAYNGLTGTDTNAIVVPQASDLPPILRDSIVMPTGGELLNGSLGAGSGIGADGGKLQQFTLDGTTYNTGSATPSGTNHGVYDATTNSWTVQTQKGGKFAVDMDTSAYTYTPPTAVPASPELIGYTLRDFDGDTAASTLTINILPPQVITLTSVSTPIATMNMGLSGEYFGYNDTRDGIVADPAYQGATAVRLHSDDGTADAGTANNVDRLADVEEIIEGRNNNTNLINNAILSDPIKADATFSANKLEFGLPAGSNTPLFTNDLGQNGRVESGVIGATATVGGANNLHTFLKVTSGNVDGLAATSGLGDTTDAVIRMVGYIYIPAGGIFDMRVTADDGYRVLINGQNIGQADFIQSTATQTYTGVTLTEGLQPIEILYWDQGGHASFRVEFKVSGSADTTYKIIGNDEYALFSPSDAPNLAANQDIVETATNGSWAVRTGETRDGTDNSEKIIGSDGKDNINAGAGNDIVQGGAGSDTIYGGQGSDVLTGGLGSDTFAWSFADQGTVGSPARDTIADFNVASKAAGGDVLDLRDLLPTATTGAALDAYLNFSKQGADTVIDVKPDGTNVTQKIVLSGVDLGATGVNDVAIINDLIAKGKLVTD